MDQGTEHRGLTAFTFVELPLCLLIKQSSVRPPKPSSPGHASAPLAARREAEAFGASALTILWWPLYRCAHGSRPTEVWRPSWRRQGKGARRVLLKHQRRGRWREAHEQTCSQDHAGCSSGNQIEMRRRVFSCRETGKRPFKFRCAAGTSSPRASCQDQVPRV